MKLSSGLFLICEFWEISVSQDVLIFSDKLRKTINDLVILRRTSWAWCFIILIFMFIGYILHCKSDKKITYIKIASIWSDLVVRGMFISLIKSVGDSRWDIQPQNLKFFCSFKNSILVKNLEISLQKPYFDFKKNIFTSKTVFRAWIFHKNPESRPTNNWNSRVYLFNGLSHYLNGYQHLKSICKSLLDPKSFWISVKCHSEPSSYLKLSSITNRHSISIIKGEDVS